MNKFQDAVLGIINNLRKKNRLEGVILSDSYKSLGIRLKNANEKEVFEYISKLKKAYFHNIEPAKDSWHQLNGFWPVYNACLIEFGKIIPYSPIFDKNEIYENIGLSLGKNTTIAPRVQFDYFHPELIEIGENCLIGDSVKIWTHDYGINKFMISPVKIGNNVRIGSETVIGPGTIIGDNVKINFGAFLYGQTIPDNAKISGREKSVILKN